MVGDLTERGMHRLMVEPGAGLATQLFASDAESAWASENTQLVDGKSQPLWNRLDLWQSTDFSVEKRLEGDIALGSASRGLEFPGLPKNVIAKESAMVGRDVLTVYYPA